MRKIEIRLSFKLICLVVLLTAVWPAGLALSLRKQTAGEIAQTTAVEAAAPLVTVIEPADQLVTATDSVILKLNLAKTVTEAVVNAQKITVPAGGGEVDLKINLQGLGKHLLSINVLDAGGQNLQLERRILKQADPSDVPSDNWARRSIVDMVTAGLMESPAGVFSPDAQVSRGDLAVILVKAKGLVPASTGQSVFRDVPAADPLNGYIAVVQSAGLMSGYTDNTFRPKKTVNRAELIGIIGKLTALSPDKGAAPAFSDISQSDWVNPWAAELKKMGWLDYLKTGELAPDTAITRLELAWLLSQTPPVKAAVVSLYDWDKSFTQLDQPQSQVPPAVAAAPSVAPEPTAQTPAPAEVKPVSPRVETPAAATAQPVKAPETELRALPPAAATAAAQKPEPAVIGASSAWAPSEIEMTVKRPDPIPAAVMPIKPISVNPAKAASAKLSNKVKAISMDFRDVELSNILRVYSQETGLSVIAGPDVRGKVTVSFNKVDPQRALDLILRMNGFTYTITPDNIIIVESSSRANPLGRTDTIIRSFEIEYAKVSDVQATVAKLVSPIGEAFSNEKQNLLIVRDIPENVTKIAEIVGTLDAPPMQVLVEAALVQVELNKDETMGVDWRLNRGIQPDVAASAGGAGESSLMPTTKPMGAADAPTDNWANKDTAAGAYGFAKAFDASKPAQGLYVQVLSQGFQAYLTALKSVSKNSTILSSPSVLALDNEKAEILIGQSLGYKVMTYSGTSQSESVQFLEAGKRLSFTPHITRDGYVLMDIHPEVSEGSIENNVPNKVTTEATTKILVRDGQTIVIGGLIRNSLERSENGIPFLMDVPIFGSLFRSTTVTPKRYELIVFITPHIITRNQVAKMGTDAAQARQTHQEKMDKGSELFHP